MMLLNFFFFCAIFFERQWHAFFNSQLQVKLSLVNNLILDDKIEGTRSSITREEIP